MMMKKKSRIQIAREIIAQVKSGMQEPRFAEPVRSDIFVQAAPPRMNRQPALRERACRVLGLTQSDSLASE